MVTDKVQGLIESMPWALNQAIARQKAITRSQEFLASLSDSVRSHNEYYGLFHTPEPYAFDSEVLEAARSRCLEVTGGDASAFDCVVESITDIPFDDRGAAILQHREDIMREGLFAFDKFSATMGDER